MGTTYYGGKERQYRNAKGNAGVGITPIVGIKRMERWRGKNRLIAQFEKEGEINGKKTKLNSG